MDFEEIELSFVSDWGVFIWSFVFVNGFNVSPQHELIRTDKFTTVALKCFFAFMDHSNMLSQVTVLSKSMITSITLVWSLSFMDYFNMSFLKYVCGLKSHRKLQVYGIHTNEEKL